MTSRRNFCKLMASTLSIAFINGCLVGDGSSPVTPPEDRDRPCWETPDKERVDMDPLFSVADEDEMMIPEEEVLSVYENYEDSDYPTYAGYIDTRDNSGVVFMNVRVYAKVESAREAYQEIFNDFEEPESFSIGDEATEEVLPEHAEVVFRISNAVAHVVSYVPEEAPEDPSNRLFSPSGRTLIFAHQLRDWWGGTSDFRKEPGFCREEILEETKAG